MELPTGTVTFLFSDIEGSTQLWDRHPQGMRSALSRHDSLLNQSVTENGGYLVKTTGDGAYAVFKRAIDAVQAAISAQTILQAETWPETTPDRLLSRMGIHTGEAELRNADYHGMAVNRAARVMSAGHGGQILLSAVTADLCEQALPKGVALRDLGDHQLKGLARTERIFQLVNPGLMMDFPPLRSLGEFIVNLPVPATSFIGRPSEVRQIVDRLNNPEIRLLSLIGPGGAGKTRLAIEAAHELARDNLPRFHDGLYFAALAPLNTAESMVSAVAQILGYRFRQSEEPPRTQLLDFLRRKRVLLVLDNLEHLLDDGGASLPADILAESPGSGILVTSRTRLNIQGEHLIPITGMRTPSLLTARRWQMLTQEQLETEAVEYSAIKLFCQSAARVRPGFRITPDIALDVARICRQVQGLPLGIELAAAWLEVLPLQEIADEIERCLDILSTEQYGVPDRQRSIRAVFDTSWQLLSDRERAILPMLAVFRGGFRREAAEFVAAAGLRDLLGLVNKSWLQIKDESRGAPSDTKTFAGSNLAGPALVGGRFEIHELLRQYAEEKLRHSPELEAGARDRQARYYARFLESQRRRMVGREQVKALDAVAEEFDDIREAWEHWTNQGEFDRLVDQMLLPLFLYSTTRFVGTDVGPLLDQAINAWQEKFAAAPASQATDRTVLAILLIARATIYINYMTSEFPRVDIRTAWAIARELDADAPDRLGLWYSLLNLMYGYQVDRAAAIANLRVNVENRSDMDDYTLAIARQSLARLLSWEFAPESDLLEARRLMGEAIAVFEQLGNADATATSYADEADICALLGRYDEALAFLEQAQPLAETVGNWGLLWVILLLRREMYLQQGTPERMFPVLDEMLAMSQRVGNYRLEVWTLSWDSIYALRYHSVERALGKRQSAMIIAEEFSLVYDQAWCSWEIGEIYRVMAAMNGSPDNNNANTARQWFERARPLFEQINDDMGLAYYHRGMGDLALIRGDELLSHAGSIDSDDDFVIAISHFRNYLEWAELGNTWSRVYALCGLAKAALGLGEIVDSLDYLRQALTLVASTMRHDLEGLPVAGLAHLAHRAGEAELAAQLASAVLLSPHTWLETQNWILPLIQQARQQDFSTPADDLGALIRRLAVITTPSPQEWLNDAARVMSQTTESAP
jgi:predicted ATPase/class 3 adenylate cyclase